MFITLLWICASLAVETVAFAISFALLAELGSFNLGFRDAPFRSCLLTLCLIVSCPMIVVMVITFYVMYVECERFQKRHGKRIFDY